MKPIAILLIVAGLGLAGKATAQTGSDQDTKKPVENCQVQPDEKTQRPAQPGTNDSLSETLNPCNGVLKPPETGDKGVAAPPSDAGETPVIRPGEIPRQPSK